MQNAIGLINLELERKTTWNTKELIELVTRVNLTARFSSTQKALAFGQVCHSFSNYVENDCISSMGRNEFKKWFIVNELPKCINSFTPLQNIDGDVLPPKEEKAKRSKWSISKINNDTPPWEDSPNGDIDWRGQCERLEKENMQLKGTIQNLKVLMHNMEMLLETVKDLLGVAK